MDSEDAKKEENKTENTFTGFFNSIAEQSAEENNTEELDFNCIFIKKETYFFIQKQFNKDYSKKKIGFLLGSYSGNSERFRVWVDIATEVFYEENDKDEITFSDKALDFLKNKIKEKYPELIIVGYYYVKPGEGTSLLPEETLVHEMFFNSFWQIAYVTDPLTDEHACFGWENEKEIAPLSFRVEGDELYVALTKEERSQINIQNKKKKRKRKGKKISVGLSLVFLICLVGLFSIINYRFFISPLRDQIDQLEISLAEKEQVIFDLTESDIIIPGIPEFEDEDQEQEIDENTVVEQDPETVTEPENADNGIEEADTYRTYTIKEDDTLWDISAVMLGSGVRYKEIMELNGLDTHTKLVPGEVIKIPLE